MHAYRLDHVHLNSRDPQRAAQYYRDMFGAQIVESIQLDGQPRFDVDLGGLMIFIATAGPNAKEWPSADGVGIAHFGLRVDDLDLAVAELKAAGATFAVEPYVSTRKAGLRVAFVQAPENVLIELVERRDAGTVGA
jgi:lactoylglutathione lyase